MRIKLPYKKVELVLKTEVPLPEVVRCLVSAYGLQPYDINNGNCDYFAEDFLFAAKKLGIFGKFFVTPDDENLPGHCWAFVSGRHFDAEAPEGVGDWRELPIFKKCSPPSA
jgi:hypothetical protein